MDRTPTRLERSNVALRRDAALDAAGKYAHESRSVSTWRTYEAVYTESGMSFMTPPDPADLSVLRDRGARIMVYHGTGDPIFSVDDTETWFDELQAANGGDGSAFSRFYKVPGMGHCGGGAAADQFDMFERLIDRVEQGTAPDAIVASTRGADNAGGANEDLPLEWTTERTRPLCPYPTVATYDGTGDVDQASSFGCR